MNMAIPITIPRLGWNMEEGIFLGWLKADGEPVRAGEMLFRLESEKSAEDIECKDWRAEPRKGPVAASRFVFPACPPRRRGAGRRLDEVARHRPRRTHSRE